jgi:hypothetical protein
VIALAILMKPFNPAGYPGSAYSFRRLPMAASIRIPIVYERMPLLSAWMAGIALQAKLRPYALIN